MTVSRLTVSIRSSLESYRWASISPQRLFIVLGSVFGLAYAVLLPPFQVPDEWQHFERAYVVSTGRCVSPSTIRMPSDYVETHALFPRSLDTRPEARQVVQNVGRALRVRASSQFEDVPRREVSASIYSCLPYVGEALAMGVARTVGAGALAQLYTARLANLALYVGIVGTAIAVLPSARGVCAVLGLLPMSMQEAASASADSVTIAVSWLFTALVLRAALSDRAQVVPRDIVALIACAAALGLCKVPTTLILSAILIPPRRVRGFGSWVVLIVAVAAASLGAAALWARLNADYNAEVRAGIENATLSVGANARYLLVDPRHVLEGFAAALSLNAEFYVSSFVGLLGYLTVSLPTWYILVAVVGIVTVAIVRPPGEPAPDVMQRLLAAALFISGALTLYFAFYLTMTPVAEIVRHFTSGQGVFTGVQGRYFLPTALLGALPFTGMIRARLAYRGAAVLIVAIATSGVAAAAWALYDTQWRPSVETIEGHPPPYLDPLSLDGKMIQTNSGKLAGAKEFVYRGLRFWISDDRWFSRHHRDPQDVIVLPEDIINHLPWGGIVDDPDADFYQTATARQYDGTLIREAGRREIWTVYEGRRHLLMDPAAIAKAGYSIETVSARALQDIPVAMPILRTHRYDGRVITREGDRSLKLYVVEDGVRHWILERSWFQHHGFGSDPSVAVVDNVTFDELPVGQPYR